MHVHRLGAPRLALIARAVIGLSQHHGEVAHGRPPFLRHRIGLGCEGEGVLAARVGQSFGQVCHRVVERQAAHGQLRFLGLLLLVLGRPLALSPLVLLLLIHLVHGLHLGGPCVDHGVDASLARGKVARDVGDEVQAALLAVNVDPHARCQHADDGCHGGQHGEGQGRAHGIDRIFHAHGERGQLFIIEQVVLRQRLVEPVHAVAALGLPHALLSHGQQHVLQALRHLRALLGQGAVYARQLLGLGKAVVAGDDAVQHLAVEAADVAQVHGQLKGQRVAVAPHGRLPVVIHRPPPVYNQRVGDAEVSLPSSRLRALD